MTINYEKKKVDINKVDVNKVDVNKVDVNKVDINKVDINKHYPQNFDIDYAFNDTRKIKGMILKNGIKIVFVSDPDIKLSSCTVSIGSGSFNDDYEGSAHFLEHLLFMGSTKYPDYNEYHSYIQSCGGIENAFTADEVTCYYIGIESAFLEKGIDMLSWFFRDPLLDEKYIKSEMNIIDAEHNKNILSDTWITNDIFKKFILNKKFNKFSTGNLDSLKDITRDDILNYYRKYYVTNNMYICIVDSISLSLMIDKYLSYFNDIPTTAFIGPIGTYEKLKVVSEDLIIYSSISKLELLNIYIPLPYLKKNQNDYQIIKFISYLLGTEYETSLTYYLKENKLIKSLDISYDYFYDDIVVMSLYIHLYNNTKTNIELVLSLINKYIEILKKLDDEIIEKLYNNYRKILMTQSLYNDKEDSVEVGRIITTNMIYGELRYALQRDYITSECDYKLIQLIKDKINNIFYKDFKITTNINFLNIDKKKFKKSNYYGTRYTPTTLTTPTTPIIPTTFNINKLILINNLNFNMDIINIKFDKSKRPIPINDYENNKDNGSRGYILDCNKFNKPISKVVIIRKNKKLLDRDYHHILDIYIMLCYKVINYYNCVMIDYGMHVLIYKERENLIIEFSGLDNLLKDYINNIMNKISLNNLFENKNKTYFDDIIINLIEKYENNKYDSPYELCMQFLSIKVLNKYSPNELITILKKLDWVEFKKICYDLFSYNKDKYLIVGNFLHINEYTNSINRLIKHDLYKDTGNNTNIITFIDSLAESNIKKSILHEKVKDNKFHYNNYVLDHNEINKNEINNCICQCYLISSGIYKPDNFQDVIKNTLICNIIADVINEPLFTQLRTNDKLGYIVKCKSNVFNYNYNYCFLIYYLVQSEFPVKKVVNSIKKFNINYAKYICKNKKDFEKKIKMLIDSRILIYKKNPETLSSEVDDYINAICNKTFNFNINKLYLKVLKKIKINDVYDNIKLIFDKNNTSFHINVDITNQP
jgi:insulysin